MSPTLERVKHEVELLPTGEQYDLYASLRSRFEPESDDDQDAVEAAWDEEITRRVSDIKEGKAELIPGDVADQMMQDFITQLRQTKGSTAV
jgi:hypothetical protein